MKINLFLIFILLLFSSCHNSDKSVLLRLHYNKGDEQTIFFKQKSLGNKFIEMNNETEVKFTVTAVTGNNDAYDFDVDVVGLNSYSKTGDQEVRYDSRKSRGRMTAEEQEMDVMFEKVLAEVYTLKLGNRGNVIDDFKDMRRKPAEAPVDISFVQLEFPEQAVKEGYTWTVKKQNTLLNNTNSFTYTVDKITDEQVTIKINATISLKPFAGNGKATGVYIVNPKNGRLINGYLELPFFSGGGKALTSVFPK